jgi:pyruvate/2-oxoacid:ferredoxin oxidoreductase alpha subunit
MENSALTAIMLQLGSAFIGGGIASVLITEWSGRRRDAKALVLNHVTNLVNAYYLYIRLLRQAPEKRSDEALDNAHAAFISETRILSFSVKLKSETDEIWKIAQRLANLRGDDVSPDQVKSKLGKIYGDFDKELKSLVSKFKI